MVNWVYVGRGRIISVSIFKVFGFDELIEGLFWYFLVLKKGLEKCLVFLGVSGWRKWKWEISVLVVGFFYGLLVFFVFVVGLGLVD